MHKIYKTRIAKQKMTQELDNYPQFLKTAVEHARLFSDPGPAQDVFVRGHLKIYSIHDSLARLASQNASALAQTQSQPKAARDKWLNHLLTLSTPEARERTEGILSRDERRLTRKLIKSGEVDALEFFLAFYESMPVPSTESLEALRQTTYRIHVFPARYVEMAARVYQDLLRTLCPGEIPSIDQYVGELNRTIRIITDPHGADVGNYVIIRGRTLSGSVECGKDYVRPGIRQNRRNK